MKKAILVLMLAVMGAVCFAELRYSVSRSGKTTVTNWWNDNYSAGPRDGSAESHERARIRHGFVSSNYSAFYIGGATKNGHAEASYSVLLVERSSEYAVVVNFYLDGVDMGSVYSQTYFTYNAAKQDYDRWCAKYKEYVRKNYHDYK